MLMMMWEAILANKLLVVLLLAVLIFGKEVNGYVIDECDREKYISEGMDDYATKPLDVKALEKLIIKYRAPQK